MDEQPVCVLQMVIDKPLQDKEAMQRFMAGVKALFRELPRISVTICDVPWIIIEGETEDELRDYVRRLQEWTDGCGG